MSKKYIEADALITCMEENCDTWKNDYMRRGFRECARIVFDMPAADVVPIEYIEKRIEEYRKHDALRVESIALEVMLRDFRENT